MANELDIRQWSMAAERRIANAVREIEALRREIRGQRRGGGVTYPNPNRVGHVYGGAVAAGTDEAPVEGELKFARINTDTTDYENEDDTPTTFFNIGPALDDGEAVIANLDIFGKYSDGQKAIWIVGTSVGGADVPSIRVGMNATAVAENRFVTPATTYNVAWSADETLNTDTSVFEQIEGDPGIYQRIKCKVAGTYRVWYHLFFVADSSHTASEIQRATAFATKTASDGTGVTTVPTSTDVVESLHHDSDDQDVGIGVLNARACGESLYTLVANECFMIQVSFASGERGLQATGESFGAQLVKRG